MGGGRGGGWAGERRLKLQGNRLVISHDCEAWGLRFRRGGGRSFKIWGEPIHHDCEVWGLRFRRRGEVIENYGGTD